VGIAEQTAVAAINAENLPVNLNHCQCDLAQGGLFRFIPVFPRISLELLENAAFPFASRRALKYR
jgi:hypothetical protein